MMPVEVSGLSRTFDTRVRGGGLGAALRSLVRREFRQVQAVRSISFEVGAGEVVGFIGPNGAGKTTTLKMLSGVLHPTSGTARVLGFVPWRRERDYLRQIAFIRGSRPLAVPGELTVLDAMGFQQLIYEIPKSRFDANLGELTELLDLAPILRRQVRALSLGERMRAGLAWSLLYRPKVLFLDEPTIGLDVTAVGMMRRFIADYSRQTGAAVLLTSHYMADVATLCKRVLLIDGGSLAYDGPLATLVAERMPYKLLKVVVADTETPDWERFGEVVRNEEGRVSLRVRREQAPAVISRLLFELDVIDLTVEETPLEEVIDQVYREAAR
jgi:ABC-2 type transport system ATP-binding protein